jgi:hypothetical protein
LRPADRLQPPEAAQTTRRHCTRPAA